MRFVNKQRFNRFYNQTDDSGNNTLEFGCIEMQNCASSRMEEGHIVVLNRVIPFAVKFTNTYYDPDVVGVIKRAGDPGEMVLVQYAGIIEVCVMFPEVRIGDRIFTGNISGHAYAQAAPFTGAMGTALTYKAYGSSGYVQMLLTGGMPEIY